MDNPTPAHPNAASNARTVRDYHERTKHRPDRYAASLGYMDWENQPDPFRTFMDAEQIDLPHPDLRTSPAYDDLFARSPDAARLDAELLGRLFYHSLALSAWKQAPHTRAWSLRINPSSGALYPTEGYLVSGPIAGPAGSAGLIDQPGIFHYAPFGHRLERRASLSANQWEQLTEALPESCLLIGLTSIYWRESWKYGERAFRYCQHDVGHAIGALSFAARTLGWRVRLMASIADADLNRLLGTHLQTGMEAEHADCLLALYPAAAAGPEPDCLPAGYWQARVPDTDFGGKPNTLSRRHHRWPVIEAVSQASRHPATDHPDGAGPRPYPDTALPVLIPSRAHPAEQIIRQRRSAVAMDGRTWLDRAVFYQMLQRTLPAQFPFGALPWQPRVSLALFVHRVRDLEPGIYLFARHPAHETDLRRSLRPDFQWSAAEGFPGPRRLYRLRSDDVRRTARMVSCHQEIAGDGVFSLGMLAQFDTTLGTGRAWNYPRLFWECGLIGQVLYLEAEAAGVRGTGIGCFFDDVMHGLLGAAGHGWQSLYHFTVGGPVTDTRLKTLPPYAHLDLARQSV